MKSSGRYLIVAVALGALVSCAEKEAARPMTAAEISANMNRAPEAAPDWFYESEAKDRVREVLRSPKSAEFSNLSVRKSGPITAVCGYVNAENGFGGMTGPQRFISDGGEVTVLDGPGGRPDFARTWDQLCA